MDDEEAELKTVEDGASVGKIENNSETEEPSAVDKPTGIKNIQNSDMTHKQDNEHDTVSMSEESKPEPVILNQNGDEKGIDESITEESKNIQGTSAVTIKENDPDITKENAGDAENIQTVLETEKIGQSETAPSFMPQTTSPAILPRSPIKPNDRDSHSGSEVDDKEGRIYENVDNTDDTVHQREEEKNSNDNPPCESPRDTSINSPRTPLSGIASDQDVSFNAYTDEEDNSLMAQQLVNQVIDKAVDTVTDSGENADGDLDHTDETHQDGVASVGQENQIGEDHKNEVERDTDAERILQDGDDSTNDDPHSDELNNIFLQRGRGNGKESENDDDDTDSQEQPVLPDDTDGSRISLPVQQEYEDAPSQDQANEIKDVRGVVSPNQQAIGGYENHSNENIPKDDHVSEHAEQLDTQLKALNDATVATEAEDMKDPQIDDVMEGNSPVNAQGDNQPNAVPGAEIEDQVGIKADSVDDEVPENEDSEEDEVNFIVDEKAHPGFPLVYGNYKACREVSPGVKECLIFETGEINKENKKSRIRSDSSSTASPVKLESDQGITISPRSQEEKKVFKINKADLIEGGICIHPGMPIEINHSAPQISDTLGQSPSEVPEHDEELVSDSQMLTHESLSPSPKAARYAPSFNIDNYTNVRKDLFTRSNGEEYDEENLVPEQENKENIPESRLKKKSRNSPLGRPPAGRVAHQEEGSRYSEYSPDVVSSPPSSGPIPGFNTMQEQQVNWLRMFKVLEDQHRSELKAQYSKHSYMIEQMQNTMETELKKQQNNIQRRLEAHRDALTETTQDETSSLSVYGYYTNDPGNLRRSPKRRSPRSGSDVYLSAARSPRADGYHSDSSDIDPLEIRRRMYTTGSSRAPDGIQGPADISDYSTLPSDSFHVKKTLDAEYDSTQTSILLSEAQRSPRSLLERPRSADGGERLLRGGVYSTPMPMSKGRSPQTVYDSGGLNDTIYRSGSGAKASRSSDLRYHGNEENEDSLSYSSNVKLREKHAKHIADLKAYYEEEIQALRTALSSSHSNKETPNERILKEDSQDLRRRCEDLTDELDDANNRIRDLEQKIQGLEIRANDYSDRYKDSQVTVLTLKTRLEELHSYAKERDHMLDSLEQKVKHQAMALQDSYKIQDELQQTSKHDQMALERTLCKYEDLDKEYRLLKESFISKERSLYDARAELSDLNKTVSRLELKIKQLMRENDNLLHKSAIAMNMSSAKTSYEDSYSVPEQSSQQFPSYMSNHYDKNTVSKHHENYQDSSHYNDYNLQVDLPEKPKNTRVSPLIKAEQELIKLQTNSNLSDNLDFKIQKKFYGSDNNYPACNRDIASGSRIDIKAPVKHSDVSPRSRATWNKGQPKRSNLKTPVKDMMTPTRFDVSVKDVSSNGKDKKKVVQIQEKNRTRSPRNGGSNSPAAVRGGGDEVSKKLNGVDETLDKIRQGEVISNWRGDNSSQILSTSTNTKTESIPVQAMTREERIKERLQMIQQQEKRYDELTIEKRQLESALNRIPIHGRVGRKSITEKDDLEKKLEKVEHELGSVRMSLRKYQVLKSSR